jgi:ABC-type antimicrobial peptide transport system permease subunit
MQAIVGVVADVIENVAIAEPLVMYVPMSQAAPTTEISWIVRATSPTAANHAVTGLLRQLDVRLSPAPMTTIRDRLGSQMQTQRFAGVVMGTLGILAVMLTTLGTSVLSQTMASSRRREMGIRDSLGATPARLAVTMLGAVARIVGIGAGAGLLGACIGAGTIRGFLFAVQPLDPLTVAVVTILIVTLTLAVSLGPALRTAKVDIASTLRET